MNLSAEQICHALPKGRRIRGDEYRACCPAHDDNSPSLSITQTSDRVLVKCWSGCSQDEVLEALRSRGLWPRRCDVLQQPEVTGEEIDAFIAAHENMLKRGIPVSRRARNIYRRYQGLKYSPFTAEEVAEMHLFCEVFAGAVRRGEVPSQEDEERFLAYLPHVTKLEVPYEW